MKIKSQDIIKSQKEAVKAFRIFKKFRKTPLLLLFTLLVFVLTLFANYFVTNIQNTTSSANNGEVVGSVQEGEYKVVEVTDGDTISVDINGKKEKVRYIGIDTPETVKPNTPVQCFGKEASNKNKELVLGKVVKLESDVQDKDTFGRLLRYVYIKNSDESFTMVNTKLVEEGYASVATFPPNVKNVEMFKQAERLARDEKRGLWKECKSFNSISG